MRTARRITFNFLSLFGSELIAKLLQFFIFIFLARIYGKVEFGNFGFAFAFATLIVIIADFGLNTLLVREIATDKKRLKKYVSNAFGVKIFLSAAAFIVAYAYLNLLDYGAEIKALAYMMVAFMIIQSFNFIFYSVFRAFEKMHFDAIVKVVRMLILSAAVFYAMFMGKSMLIVALIFPITEIFMLILTGFIYMKNFARISVQLDFKFIIRLLRKSLFFGLSLVFVLVLLYIDTIMLERIKGPAEVGIYAAAYQILFGLTFIPLMYATAVYPVFSNYFMKDFSLLRFAFKKSFQYMLILGLPASIGLFVYARNIINLVYGVEYAQSIIALKILCWFVVLRFINYVTGTVLSSIHKQGSRVFSQGLVMGINILLNLYMIPRYGFIGAGIATIISESFFLVFYYYFLLKYKLNIGIIKSSIKPIIAAILMYFIIIRIGDLLIGAIVGAFSYFLALVILKAFGAEDKRLLAKVMKNT